ncbi:YjbQ family protein [bacterium]|nr:YjbQ family protein [bacterium]
MHLKFSLRTSAHNEFIDITALVQKEISARNIEQGICLVYVPHTTAGVTINENADPSVKSDIINALKKIVPDNLPYTHMEGNSPGHIKASLTGSSVSAAINNFRLVLGRWQGIFFAEFDGPRNRSVNLTIY